MLHLASCALKSTVLETSPRWCHKGPSQRVMSQDLSQVGANTLVRCWLRPPPSLFFCHLPNMQKIQSSITFKQQQQTEGYIFCFFWRSDVLLFLFPITLCKVARREARVRNRGWNYLTLNRQYNKMRNHQFKKCGVKGRTGLPGKCYYGERAPPPDQWLNIYIFFLYRRSFKTGMSRVWPAGQMRPANWWKWPAACLWKHVSCGRHSVLNQTCWLCNFSRHSAVLPRSQRDGAGAWVRSPRCWPPRVFSLYLCFFLFF